jgi:soluble P-type ATPase
MLEIEILGWRTLALSHLILDVNGTLTRDGTLLEGIPERVEALKQQLTVELLTADTHGRLDMLKKELGIQGQRLVRGQPEAPQKSQRVRALGADHVAAIGNGANDLG